MISFLLIIFLAIYGIQGGSDPTTVAKAGEVNYFVMVWHSGKFHCGGTIIDQRHIITKGSCVIGIASAHLSVIAGTIDTKLPGVRPLQVESVYIHYGFKAIVGIDGIDWLHNVAILRLVNRMVWNLLMAPAVLKTGDYQLRSKCIVPGWRHAFIGSRKEHYYIRWNRGYTREVSHCIEVGLRLLKHEGCSFMPRITVLYRNTTHFYNGSPIVCENFVVGIVDAREQETFYGFLTLFPYKDFIENAIDDRKYDVNPGEINYVVSIWYEYRFKCGGIIFDASHILTTADCVQYANDARVQVVAGYTQILEYNDQIQWLSVNNIDIHPDYEEIIHFDGPKCLHAKNNYALLTLAVPLEWGPTIGPAPLPNRHFVPTNCACRAYRWHNAYAVDNKVLLQLIWSQDFIMDAEVCQGAGIGLDADEICVNSQFAQHPRNFDSSGNPVVCEGFVLGIIKPDYPAAPQFSNLTSILSISPFINSLNDACYIPPIY